jgi:hypothetical protein
MAVAFWMLACNRYARRVVCKDEFVEGMFRIREKKGTWSSQPPKSDGIVSSETGVQAIHGENAICCVHQIASVGDHLRSLVGVLQRALVFTMQALAFVTAFLETPTESNSTSTPSASRATKWWPRTFAEICEISPFRIQRT